MIVISHIFYKTAEYFKTGKIVTVTVKTFEMDRGQIDASVLTAKLPIKRDRWYHIPHENRIICYNNQR